MRMTQAYFLAMTIGFPLLVLVLAILSGHLYRGGHAELLDWKPTRTPEQEAELEAGDIDHMLAAQNRYRRLRGAPERSLEELTQSAWVKRHGTGEALAPEERN
jgi:hypothetical protein